MAGRAGNIDPGGAECGGRHPMTAEHHPHHRAPALPSDLGELRTIMAADRTLMAWIRTSLSMLSFGFTIYKFLEEAAGSKRLAHPESPQQVGLFLVALGIASMLLGTLSYWSTLRDLNQVEQFRLGRPTLLIAAIMSAAGVVLFVSIWIRRV
jgi:putative membrane protein